jgi:general secretion pathway protein M
MNETSSQRHSAWQQSLGRIQEIWRTLALRERIAVAVAALFLVVFFIWLIAIYPAWKTVRDTPKKIDYIEQQIQRLNRLALEASEFRREPPVPPSQAENAIRVATGRLGERGRVTLQGERATVSLTNVRTEELSAWLSEVRSAARARPVEAELSRSGEGYSGNIILNMENSAP